MITVKKIKMNLSNLFGKKVKVIYYGTRNRNEIYYGYIFKLYNNIFIIKLNNGDIKSFNYVDILTKSVKILCYFNK